MKLSKNQKKALKTILDEELPEYYDSQQNILL